MAVITAQGESYHTPLGGSSHWPPADFTYLSLSFEAQVTIAPPPFQIYPSWRRPWRLIKAN